MKPTLEEIEARHIVSLQAFVLRARRVLAHSLASDLATLQQYQHPRFQLEVDATTGQPVSITRVGLPDEELLESAAARVRPFLLNGEAAHRNKVLNALTYFASKANLSKDNISFLRGLKRRWNTIDDASKETTFYQVQHQHKEEPATTIGDNELGFGWIYGDVVHADSERREATEQFGVGERFRAAVPVVVTLMLLTHETFTIIEQCVQHGVIPSLGNVFEEPVVASEDQPPLQQVRAWVAERAADGSVPEIPAIGEPMGEEWKPFSEVFHHPQVPTQPSNEQGDAVAT